MEMTLGQMLDSVSTRETFLGFLKRLQLDREEELRVEAVHPSAPYSRGAMGWENGTIEAFLDSMHAWAIDSNGLGPDPTWQSFAQLLRAGKEYEQRTNDQDQSDAEDGLLRGLRLLTRVVRRTDAVSVESELYKSTLARLSKAKVSVESKRYDWACFGSWEIRCRTTPSSRIIRDGKESMLFVETLIDLFGTGNIQWIEHLVARDTIQPTSHLLVDALLAAISEDQN